MCRRLLAGLIVFGVFCIWASAQPLLTDPKVLSTPVGDSEAPRLATSGSNLYLAYRGDPFANGASETRVLFRRSLDGGQTWRETLNLTDLLSASDTDTLPHKAVEGPALAAFAGNVYVVWADGASGNYEIYLMRSADGGATFAPAQGAQVLREGNISETEIGDSRCPAVAADGSNVYVVWKDNTGWDFENHTSTSGLDVYRVWYARSTNGGQTFSDPTPILDSTLTAQPRQRSRQRNGEVEAHCPAIAADQGTVVVAWAEEGERGTTIQLVRSFNSGENFFSPIPLASKRQGRVESLRLAAYGSLFVAAWAESDDSDRGDGFWKVFVARSPNRGRAFRVGEAISLQTSRGRRRTPADPEGHSKFPDITIWNGSVWLTLANNKDGDFDVYLFQSTNGGRTFSNLGKITDNPSNSLYPAITAQHDRLHIVWADDATPPLPSRLRLYYRQSAPWLGVTSLRAGLVTVRFEPSKQGWGIALGGVEAVQLELRIYDLSGQLIQRHRASPGSLVTFPMERPLANGIYLYAVIVERRDGLSPLYFVGKVVILR
jgi:hypothetical protein